MYIKKIEQEILSEILYNNKLMDKVADKLKVSDFTIESHQRIYKTILNLYNSNLPITDEFGGKFFQLNTDMHGISDEIENLINDKPKGNIEQKISELHNYKISYDLNNLKVNMMDELFLFGDYYNRTCNDIADDVQNNIYNIITKKEDYRLDNISNIVDIVYDEILDTKNKPIKLLQTLPTGIDSLDKSMGGFGLGELSIIASEASIGKSSLILQTILENINIDNGVLFFSMDMTPQKVVSRLLFLESEIDLFNTDDINKEKLSESKEKLSNAKLFIDDNYIDIYEMKANIRKLALDSNNNIKLVAIDYYQMMKHNPKLDYVANIDKISMELKKLAHQLNIAIVLLYQLDNKLTQRHCKKPILSDLANDGVLEQNADLIMFMHNEDKHKEQEELDKENLAKQNGENYISAFINKPIETVEIKIIKSRNFNGVGTTKIDFHKPLGKFKDTYRFTYGTDKVELEGDFDDIVTKENTEVDISCFFKTEQDITDEIPF